MSWLPSTIPVLVPGNPVPVNVPTNASGAAALIRRTIREARARLYPSAVFEQVKSAITRLPADARLIDQHRAFIDAVAPRVPEAGPVRYAWQQYFDAYSNFVDSVAGFDAKVRLAINEARADGVDIPRQTNEDDGTLGAIPVVLAVVAVAAAFVQWTAIYLIADSAIRNVTALAAYRSAMDAARMNGTLVQWQRENNIGQTFGGNGTGSGIAQAGSSIGLGLALVAGLGALLLFKKGGAK